MIKLNAFTTHIHAQYDFLKGAPIERLIKDIKKEDLADHGSLVGNAKSTFNSSKSYFLDRHNSVKHRVEEKLFYPKLEITRTSFPFTFLFSSYFPIFMYSPTDHISNRLS